MNTHIPIIDLELIDLNMIKLENLSGINIRVINARILLSYSKDSIRIHSNLLYNLRTFIDELYKKSLSEDEYMKLRSRVNGEINQVTVNFIINQSQARLIPSNSSSNEIVIIKEKKNFYDLLQKFYPHMNTLNPKYYVVGDFILKIFISKNNNFCSFLIVDADISYEFNKNRTQIYKNTSSVEKIIDSIEI